jgi:hypothetical protein
VVPVTVFSPQLVLTLACEELAAREYGNWITATGLRQRSAATECGNGVRQRSTATEYGNGVRQRSTAMDCGYGMM